MLIERTKTHPEEFRGKGRFTSIVREIKSGEVPAWVSRRDVAALADAFDLLLEDLFTEHIVAAIVGGVKEEAEEGATPTQGPRANYKNTAQVAEKQAALAAHRAAMQQNVLAGIGNRAWFGNFPDDRVQEPQNALIAKLFK